MGRSMTDEELIAAIEDLMLSKNDTLEAEVRAAWVRDLRGYSAFSIHKAIEALKASSGRVWNSGMIREIARRWQEPVTAEERIRERRALITSGPAPLRRIGNRETRKIERRMA